MNYDLNAIVSEKVLNFIKEKCWSKTRFCLECKINPYTLSKILGNQNFRIGSLFKIAKVMKIRTSELVKC